MNKLINRIEIVEKYIILATVFAYPLFLAVSFSNIFEVPKLLLLMVSIAILVLLKIVKIVIKNELEINNSKFDIFSLLIALVYLLSGILVSPNIVEAFFLPGTASFIILSVIFYFLINQLKSEDKKSLPVVLLTSVFIVAIVQIMSFFGITNAISFLPEIVKSKMFNPFGNILSLTIVVVSLIPFLIDKLIKSTDIAEKILSSLVIFVFCISMGISIYIMTPNQIGELKVLSPKLGWSIAVDTLKTNPILGVGPSNFSFAFNRFRPIEFNAGSDWDLKYTQSTSVVLTALSETGIFGFSVIALLIFLLVKNKFYNKVEGFSVSLFLLGMLLFPMAATSTLIFFILLAIYSNVENKKIGHFFSKIPHLFIALPLVITLLLTTYVSGRAFYAEYLFSKSIASSNKGDGLSAYNFINKSVQLNPYSDKYHLFSAAINIALAESLAKEENITDDDKKNISQLIQQAIREGKAAVAVNRYKSSNWEALSGIYQTLMAFAQGSDKFALESLSQAISLDPINPVLRIKMGSLYYTLEKYDLAVDSLKLAVIAKPDYPNSHYNLALAYKEAKNLERAKEEINTTLSLLGKGTLDYEKALSELQKIEELSSPSETTDPAIEPKIELPDEYSPEVIQE